MHFQGYTEHSTRYNISELDTEESKVIQIHDTQLRLYRMKYIRYSEQNQDTGKMILIPLYIDT